MTLLYDKSGQQVDVPDDQVAQALGSGEYGLVHTGEVDVVDSTGQGWRVKASGLIPLLEQGFHIESGQERVNRLYGDQEAMAGALGLARGATLGLSDLIATDIGQVDPAKLRGLEQANPVISGIAEAAGAIAPSLIPGTGPIASIIRGAGAPSRFVAGTGRRVEGEILKYLTEKTAPAALAKAGAIATGNTSLAREALAKGAAFAAAGITEGSLYGVAQAIDEKILGNPDEISELLVAQIGPAAIASGLAGGILGAASVPIGKALVSMTKVASDKITDAIGGAANMAERYDRRQLFEKLGVSNVKPYIKRKGMDWAATAEDVLRKEKTPDGLPLVTNNIGTTAERMRKTVEAHGAELGLIRQEADVLIGTATDKGPSAKRVLEKLQALDTKYAKQPSYRPARQEWQRYLKTWKDEDAWSFKEMQKLESDLSGAFERRAAKGSRDWGIRRVWETMRDERDLTLETLLKDNPARLAQYKHSKRVYHALTDLADQSELEAFAGSKSDTVWRTVLKFAADKVLGRMAWTNVAIPAVEMVFGPAGRTGQLANKAARLRAIQARVEYVNERLDKAITNFTKGGGKARLVTSKVITDAVNERDKRKATKKFALRLHNYIGNPMSLADNTAASLIGLEDSAPALSQAIATKTTQIVAALQALAPLPPSDVFLQPEAVDWDVDEIAAETFHPIAAGHLDPIGVIEEAFMGIGDPKAIEIVKQQYPSLMATLTPRVLMAITESRRKLTWRDKVTLSILFDAPVDPLLRPASIKRAQDIYAPPPKQGQGPQGVRLSGLEKFDDARTMFETTHQRTEAAI